MKFRSPLREILAIALGLEVYTLYLNYRKKYMKFRSPHVEILATALLQNPPCFQPPAPFRFCVITSYFTCLFFSLVLNRKIFQSKICSKLNRFQIIGLSKSEHKLNFGTK